MKWDEAKIRKEIMRLDGLTGLNGNSLPIQFTNAKSQLGCYCIKDGKPHMFKFSRAYFEDEGFSTYEALDTIRHEYAHYMDHVINGRDNKPHGKLWKNCCLVVGAKPCTYYSRNINEIQLQREHTKADERKNTQSYLASLRVGEVMIHPSFGEGTVSRIDWSYENMRVELKFSSGESKIFGAKWLAEQCRKKAA